jgi:hypothetical protein
MPLPAISVPPQPGGNWYVTSTQANASSWASTVDTAQGYPKAGVNIGGGQHCSVAEGTTKHYGPSLQHPTLQLWAYISDSTTVPLLVGATALPVPAALDSTWVGATAVTPTTQTPTI